MSKNNAQQAGQHLGTAVRQTQAGRRNLPFRLQPTVSGCNGEKRSRLRLRGAV